jgi:hypothetical protein
VELILGRVLYLERFSDKDFIDMKAASDSADLVQKCENCHKCARDQKQPLSLTQLIQPT